MYYLFLENIFVDKDKDKIASSVKIGFQKIEKFVCKFLIFYLEFSRLANREMLCLASELECSQSEILGFIKQLDFIALYFDTFTLGKSRDLNSKQFQQTIRKLCGLEPRDNIIQ